MFLFIPSFFEFINRLPGHNAGLSVSVCSSVAYQKTDGKASLTAHAELTVQLQPRDFPRDSPCHNTRHITETKTPPHLRGKK